MLFPICVVKHSEDPKKRNYKGRVVFQGNNIRGEFGLQEFFPDQGSGASFMTASRVLDAVSLLPNNSGQQSDAPQAYTQCNFGIGSEDLADTWIELPREQWPKHWHGMSDTVCPLVLALYGHPLSGTFWENYYSEIAITCGFEPIQAWECLYIHRGL